MAARGNVDSWSLEPSPGMAITRGVGWPSPGVARAWPSCVQLAGRPRRGQHAEDLVVRSSREHVATCISDGSGRWQISYAGAMHRDRFLAFFPKQQRHAPRTPPSDTARPRQPARRCSAAWPLISSRSAGKSLTEATVRPLLLPRVVPEQSGVGQQGSWLATTFVRGKGPTLLPRAIFELMPGSRSRSPVVFLEQ
jgi:hypothetical protein